MLYKSLQFQFAAIHAFLCSEFVCTNPLTGQPLKGRPSVEQSDDCTTTVMSHHLLVGIVVVGCSRCSCRILQRLLLLLLYCVVSANNNRPMVGEGNMASIRHQLTTQFRLSILVFHHLKFLSHPFWQNKRLSLRCSHSHLCGSFSDEFCGGYC